MITIPTAPVTLLEPPPSAAGLDDLQTFLDNFHNQRPRDTLEWVLRPMLHKPFVEHGGTRSRAAPLLVRHIAAASGPRRGVEVHLQAHVAFAVDGTNLRRVLDPLIKYRAGGSGTAKRIDSRLSPPRLARWTRRAISHADALVRSARRNDMPVRSADVRKYCLAGARALTRAEGLLHPDKVRLLVVATQHAPNVRALLKVARERGIPAVYFPHAPVAGNRQYADLPTDYAGLRGIGEAELYRGYGVREALSVIGNPALDNIIGDDITRMDTLGLNRGPVFAVSPNPRSVLADLFRLTISVLGSHPLIVAPHPRSNTAELLRLMPPAWHLWSGDRTFDLLRQGPRFVLQHSSGIAWEALALGVPVIQLTYKDQTPNYPFITPPHVLFAHSTESLGDAVAEASRRSHSVDERSKLKEWADYWCIATGEGARRASIGLIEEALDSGPRTNLLLDGWNQAE